MGVSKDPTINIFACKHCKQALGVRDERALIIGGCRFERQITFACLRCGRLNRWNPPRFFVREIVAITTSDSVILVTS